MEYKLSVVINKDDKHYVAKGVEIELASQGSSVEEALRNLQEAFELWLKHADDSERASFKTGSPLLTHVAVEA